LPLREQVTGLEKLGNAQQVAMESCIAAKDARIALLMKKVAELEHKLSVNSSWSSGPCVRFTVLGSAGIMLEDGRDVPLRQARIRNLLATLLLHANHPVTTSSLCDMLADGGRPLAGSTLRSHVSAFRRAAAPIDCVQRDPVGYVAVVAPGTLDLELFRNLAECGRQALADGDSRKAELLLREATGLWQEPVLRDVPPCPQLQPLLDGLLAERQGAVEALYDARLAMGQHQELVYELRAQVGGEPLNERCWVQLMLALYRSGRQAEAFEAYARLRTLLAEEYGADPDRQVQDFYQKILRADPVLDLPR
jgi:DNA-binding SARP family transcriptional activator